MHSFAERIHLRDKSVMAYSGVSASGSEFFAYVLCAPEKLRLMQDDQKNKKPRSIFDYGEVLYTEFTSQPSEKAQEFLQKWCAENGGSLLA